MKTGMDEHGIQYPLYFEAFNEYKHGFYIYSMIPSIFVFGLTNFGIRLTSVVFGMLGIVLLYLIASVLFSRWIGLLSVFFLSFMPWHLHHSRVGFEVISFAFLFSLGLFLALLGFQSIKNTKDMPFWIWLYLSSIFFGISIYSYGVARLFVPLFLLGMFFIYRDFFRTPESRKILLLSIFIFIILSFPAYYFSIFGEVNARFHVVSLFKNSETPLPSFFINYLSHYSPSFLFFSGDPQIHNAITGWGELTYSSLLFVPFGLFWLFQNRKQKEVQLILLWFFLYAIPASFTYGDLPHAARTFIATPLYAIITALGFVVFCFFLHQRIFRTTKNNFSFLILIIGMFLLLEVGILAYDYFVVYKRESSDAWLSFAEPTVQYMEENKEHFDHIYLSESGFHVFYVYILYYIQADPQQYIEQGLESFGYQLCDINLCFNASEKNLYVLRGYEVKIDGTYNIPYSTRDGIVVKFFETEDIEKGAGEQ